MFEIKFDKSEFEEVINSQISELKDREKTITALLKSINDHTQYEKERQANR
jgi:hypothetical protein